jgi:hypothetical protein
MNFNVPDAKAKDIDLVLGGTHKIENLGGQQTLSSITPSTKYNNAMRDKLMSRPTFRHDDGAGPIAPKHNAVAWSDYVKPSIEYDI